MDGRKPRHDYINSVQILKNFVRMVSKGKLDPSSEEGAAIVKETQTAIEFLESCSPSLSTETSPG